MTSSNPRQRSLGGLLLAAALFPSIVSAQSLVRPLEVYGTFGLGQVYLDSSFLDHSEAGGGARLFLTWGPTNRTVRPYWLAGIAVSAGGEANTAVGANGGLGARIFVGDRYFLAPEVRGGLGPIFRASISGGIALGGE